MKKPVIRSLTLILGLAWSSLAAAIPDFLVAWQAIHPNSNSDDIGCQLCHQSAAGNQPWNPYGWTIRQIYRSNGFDIDEAITFASSIDNHDNDPSGASSAAEIEFHYQPGWTEGAVNTVTSTDGSQAFGQLPPSIAVETTKIDPASPAANSLPTIGLGEIVVSLETIAGGFTAPVMAAAAPGIPGFLFVVEQTGEIWRVNLADGSKLLFHDVGPNGSDLLVPLNSGFDERGLLGLAFDPDYLNNGFFYTYQSEPISGADTVDFSTMPMGQVGDHQTVISEWITNNPGGSFSVSTIRRVLLRIEQPQFNHNGGMLAFGPDGHLYISLGDGGGADDIATGHGVNGNGRDNTNPLGAILRIEPRGNNAVNGEYGIPIDNPFVASVGLNEIYAYGFRNPYRFSFDSQCYESGQNCNTLLAGDVGQNQIEEIDQVVIGGNYGWNWKEGSFFFYPGVPTVHGGNKYISLDPPPGLPTNLIEPLAEYSHEGGSLVSAIGGYVYRGADIPALEGRYVFADANKRLFYLDANNVIREFRMNEGIDFLIAGLGEDQNNELYLLGRDQFGPVGTTGVLKKIRFSELDENFCFPIKAKNGAVAVICL